MTSPAHLGEHPSALPGFFTTAEAYAAGLTARDLVDRTRFRQVFRGGYVKTEAPAAYADLVRFALRVVPAAEYATEHSAARLLGGITPAASSVHLGTTFRHQCKSDGIQLRFYTHRPEVVQRKGVWVTSPAQTFLDLARALEFVDLLVLGDSLVKRAGCSRGDILRFIADANTHGARHAREVARAIRAGVESPNETRLRLLMHSGGLPEPTVNLVVAGRNDHATRRIDLAYQDWKVGVEFDGRHHVERIGQWQDDILRREELEASGWRFVIITASAMYADPLGVLQRIRDALALAGAPDIQLHDGWRRHFG